MTKILYVLNYQNTNYLVYEKNSIKYFELEDNKNILNTIGDYLIDKLAFSSLSILKKKHIIYDNCNYIIATISVKDLKEIIDKESIKSFFETDIDSLIYRDSYLLNDSFSFACKSNNLNIKKIPNTEKRNIINTIIFAVIISVLSCSLLVGNLGFNYFGISIPIITIIFAIFSIILIKRKGSSSFSGIYFICISILLSTTYAIYTNPLLRFINIVLIPFSLLFGLLLLAYPNLKLNLFTIKNVTIPNITIRFFTNSHFNLIPSVLKNQKIKINKDTKSSDIIKGILISIPLLIVLFFLLCSADKMFANTLSTIINSVFEPFTDFRADSFILRILIFIIVFVYSYYFFSTLKSISFYSTNKITKYINKDMANTVLVIINTLYLFFTFIQIKYLYIKSNSTLSPEEYSDYARSGFFQLMAVVMLNIIIIIFINNKVQKNKLTYILNTLTTIISINMSITSFYKMSLYIMHFGLTRLRFLTSIFIVYTLIILLLICIALWKKFDLIKYAILIGSIMYLFINFSNMDKLITKYNLSILDKNIDVEYLMNLSMDNIDELIDGCNNGKINKDELKKMKEMKHKGDKWYEYNYYNKKHL